jgi:hypothetical protein
MDLSDRICLITGASGGIGREVALQLAAGGATVALSARREPDLHELAARIGECASVHPCDLSDPAHALRLADEVIEKHGRIDVLACVAGVKVSGPTSALSLDDLDTSFQVNAIAPISLAGRVAPAMAERGSGVIATVTTSIAGGRRDLGAYAGAKAALASMTQTLRQEVGGKGVAVFSFDPGWVRTGMSPDGKEEPADAAARLVAHIAEARSSREVLV